MEVMKEIRYRFVLVGVCPSKSNDPFLKFRNLLIGVISLFLFIFIASSTTTFILKNLENDLKNCLYSSITLTISIALAYVMIASYILRHKVTEIFDAFQVHYNNCN